MLNLYTVWGPTYSVEEPISFMLRGPRHETQDFISVMARNKDRAKVLAVKVWRKYPEQLRGGSVTHNGVRRKYTVCPGYWWGDTAWKNPFGMLTAEKVGPVERWREIMHEETPDFISADH